MAWVEDRVMLQQFPNKLSNIFETAGWTEFAKYRAKQGNKYGEVRLFESTGSDKEKRKFGIIHTYDLDKPTFPDQRYIQETSQLAVLGVADGVKKTFTFPAEYILPGTEKVYINGELVDPSEYEIDPKGRTITFHTAPASGVIKASYYLSSKAYEPTNSMGVFLFDEFYYEEYVQGEVIGTADGTTTTFLISNSNIRPGTVKVYVNGVLADEFSYRVDHQLGTVTFYTAPDSGEIKVDYCYIIPPVEGHDYGDIEVTNAVGDIYTSDGMGNLAFGAVTFINPSIPTVFNFFEGENFHYGFGRDSYMDFWGNANKDRIALFFRVNPSADAANKAWFVPFYVGRIHNNGEKPRRNTALIGGARTGVTGTWAKDKKLGNTLVDYGPQTSNGNNHIIIHQDIGGAYYQRHYFGFITHDKAIDEDEATFQPSAYTNKYHLPRLWIVHPYDGHVAMLDDIYAVHPKNIEQEAELENEKTVVHELIGTGNGVQTVFHLENHCQESRPHIFFDCIEQTTGFTYDPETKAVEFAIPPAPGVEITASYTVKELYKYTLPTTPLTPMRLDETTPFNPIGWAIFKENL